MQLPCFEIYCIANVKQLFCKEMHRMKKFMIIPAALLALLLSSCASSERLTRMSGGVLDEYSAPKQYRLRSEKYQAQSRVFSSDKKISHGKAAGLDDTLVNIWPFFFASNNYWSALWPMIDSDPYGFAVRPFFNKEGNDCSVLFPLTSWNSESKSGWIANFAWKPGAFGFIPLTWQSSGQKESFYYYTPLFVLKQNRFPLTYKNTRNSDYQYFCCLAYGEKEHFIKYADSPHSWLFYEHDTGESFKNMWAYCYRNGGAPGNIPADKKELEKLKEHVFKQLKTEESDAFGVFPLFHINNQTNGNRKYNSILLLAGYEKNKKLLNWSLLAGLAFDYRHEKFPGIFSARYARNSSKEVVTCKLPLLFTRYNKAHLYTGKRHQLFCDFKEKNYRESFAQALPRLQKILKEISPGAEFPKEVKDWNTFYLFKAELAAKENFQTEEHTTLFAGPFFYSENSQYRNKWVIPVLLSWGENSEKLKKFTSLPLLTFIKEEQNNGYTNIMPPLLVWSNFKKKDQLNKPVHSNTCKWSGKHGVVEEKNQYAALGLFYRGRHAFTVAKEGIDHTEAEFVRKNMLNLGENYQHWTSDKKRLDKRQSETEAWKTANKIEYYKKLIKFEELKNERKTLDERKKKYDDLKKKVTERAKSLGVLLNDSDFADIKSSENAVNRFLKQTTQLRWKEDIGSGLFFRKEKFYNGDYEWHFCHILAGGRKEGDRQSSHILHLLYRRRQDGEKTETIFFPFISHVRDGKNERTSFLWRVFSIGQKNGKTGGHILFIPFGEKI